MQKWDGCCCEMLSPIAGRDAGGQEQVKSRSRWVQNGARCREGDAKVDRENAIVEFSIENCTDQNPRSRRHASDKTDAGGFKRQSRGTARIGRFFSLKERRAALLQKDQHAKMEKKDDCEHAGQ